MESSNIVEEKDYKNRLLIFIVILFVIMIILFYFGRNLLKTGKLIDEPDQGCPYVNNGYIVFGTYEQDGNLSNGPEPIEWEILGEDENGIYMISRYILDYQPYNTTNEDVTWEESSLRKWLNEDFYNNVFTETEQEYIETVYLENDDNTYYDIWGGYKTKDKIFVPSLNEINKYYSFSYFDINETQRSEHLIIAPTKYLQQIYPEIYVKKIWDFEYSNNYKKYGYSKECIGKEGFGWVTRTPGEENNKVVIVTFYGATGMGSRGKNVEEPIGIRPAVYVTEYWESCW